MEHQTSFSALASRSFVNHAIKYILSTLRLKTTSRQKVQKITLLIGSNSFECNPYSVMQLVVVRQFCHYPKNLFPKQRHQLNLAVLSPSRASGPEDECGEK